MNKQIDFSHFVFSGNARADELWARLAGLYMIVSKTVDREKVTDPTKTLHKAFVDCYRDPTTDNFTELSNCLLATLREMHNLD